ncbi:MAG: hypothetical protein WAN82_03710 [Candidatus Bathyarchaeia archaeon]
MSTRKPVLMSIFLRPFFEYCHLCSPALSVLYWLKRRAKCRVMIKAKVSDFSLESDVGWLLNGCLRRFDSEDTPLITVEELKAKFAMRDVTPRPSSNTSRNALKSSEHAGFPAFLKPFALAGLNLFG